MLVRQPQGINLQMKVTEVDDWDDDIQGCFLDFPW
jgi:hypothetical protein